MKKTDTISIEEIKLKKSLENLADQEFDISGKVMDRIQGKKPKEKFQLLMESKSILAASVVIPVLLFTGFATNATELWEIRNNQTNEVSLGVERIDGNSYVEKSFEVNDEFSKERAKVIDEAVGEIEEGTIAVVYINDKKLNPNETTLWLANPVQYHDSNQYKEQLRELNYPYVKFPSAIPTGFNYKVATIMNDFDTYYNMGEFTAELKEKAETTGEKVVVKRGNWFTAKPSQTEMFFSNGNDEFKVSANITGAKRRFIPENAKVEAVTINQAEVFYIEDKDNNMVQLFWSEEGDVRINYTISTKINSELTKEQLLHIAESME